jgi:hypothetical protein
LGAGSPRTGRAGGSLPARDLTPTENHQRSAATRMNGRRPMPLTRKFKELVQKRIARDAAFGDALLREINDAMLATEIAKAILEMAT